MRADAADKSGRSHPRASCNVHGPPGLRRGDVSWDVGIHHARGELRRSLSPLPAAVARCARRCLRRDVDGPIHQSHVAAAGAWKESPDGSRSRRPDCDRCRRAPAMARRAATADEAHGRRARKGRQRPQICSRTQIAVTRAPQGSLETCKGLREPDGVPRKACRGLPGRFGPGPGLPMRRPRTRRTSGPPRR